uniref:Uncharacterized protein n=1 Tax=Panagrolaimus sp. JU765 TaxID=591449 RepID=A0AC34PZ46_9BILA
MLEYYMKQDCSLQTIGGGLLDSKGYGIALPKGSPLRHIFSKTVLQLQERTILEALKNKWWKGNRETMTCPQSSDPHKVLDRVLGIFYVMLTGLIVAFFMSIGEYCIESKQQSVRLDLTWMGKLINWFHQRKTKKEEKMLPRRPQLAATRLDQLATLTRPKPTPQSTKDSGEHYLFDEHSDSLQISSPGSITDIQRRRSQNKDEFRKITRLIPPGDEALISRRISTISR